MKKITFLLLLVASAFMVNAQTGNNLLGYKNGKPDYTSTYVKCTSFHVSKPLRDIAKTQQSKRDGKETDTELPVQVGKGTAPIKKRRYETDPIVQRIMGTMALDTPLVNVEGANWTSRPDCSVAAGPNNVVQAVNLGNFLIFDKAGHRILSTDLHTIGGPAIYDDPIVMYDRFADRWVFTGVTSSSSELTIAVSTTPDPTGSYYVYSYSFPVMPDFPKWSIWVDGYYATYRDINLDTVGLSVFDRDRMLKGSPGAGMIVCKFPNAHVINKESQLPASPKILTCDGALPPFGTPEYLFYYTNINMGDPSNSIMIYQLKTDTTAKTCKLTFVDSLATAAYNGYFAGYAFGGNIMEPGGISAWSLEGPFQYRVPYIRFTGYSSVVLCNTVNTGDSIGGIRWYELRQNDTTLKWSIYQQATYAPNDTVSRWNGSICMDMNGDISLAYNVTNSTNLYPGIRYTGRLASDPLGTMTFKEQTAMKGTQSFYVSWGDYSASCLDPDGVTFWHTNQYIIDPTGDTANTRVFSFRLTSPAGVPNVAENNAELKVYQSGSNLNVIVTDLPGNDKVVVNLFDITGRQLQSQWMTPEGNRLQTALNVGNYAHGTYLVRVGNSSFQKVVKVIIE